MELNVSKEKFSECINQLRESSDRYENMILKLYDLGINYEPKNEEYYTVVFMLIKLLEEFVGDKDKLIEYFVFECDWGKSYDAPIKSADELYERIKEGA